MLIFNILKTLFIIMKDVKEVDPIDKLINTCQLIGKECDEIVKEHERKEINDIGFVNKYFDLLSKIDDQKLKDEIIKDLEEYIRKKGI